MPAVIFSSPGAKPQQNCGYDRLLIFRCKKQQKQLGTPNSMAAPSLFFGTDNSDISQPSDPPRSARLPGGVIAPEMTATSYLTRSTGRDCAVHRFDSRRGVDTTSMRLQQLGIYVLFGVVLAAFVELEKDRR